MICSVLPIVNSADEQKTTQHTGLHGEQNMQCYLHTVALIHCYTHSLINACFFHSIVTLHHHHYTVIYLILGRAAYIPFIRLSYS